MMLKSMNELEQEADDMISLAQRRNPQFKWPSISTIEQVPRARAIKALALIIEGLNKRVLRMAGLQIKKTDGKLVSVTILFD